MVTGINHLTLAVRDLNRSIVFYAGLLGLTVRMQGPSSAYLESGTLWLALVVDSAVRTGPLPEYTHVAFSISASDLPALAAKLTNSGVICWQNTGRVDSFYFLDPDGHKLELHTGDLVSRLADRAATNDPANVEHP